MKRCNWAENELMLEYHDKEWGKETTNETVLFEFLVLESAQAGLNWLTILKKREGYREAYDNFDVAKVACYDDNKKEELRQNPAIIRNRLKINASVENAKTFLLVQKEFGSFHEYMWHFVAHKQIVNNWVNEEDIPASTSLSDKISKDMKKRGFKFIGTTIIYSYLQAIGVINDHVMHCSFR